MWENMKFKAEKSYGSMLAAYFVLSVGMVCGAGVVLFAMPSEPAAAWAVLAILGGLILLSVLVRRTDLPSRSLLGLFGSRRHDITGGYVPMKREPRSLQFGTRRPPSVDDVREAAKNANNWVPSGPISGGRAIRKR